MIQTPLTIGGAYDAFRKIYASADRMTMSGGHIERAAFLHLAWKELATCIRKRKTLCPIAVAQYAAWFFCLCESIFAEDGAKQVAEGMCKKYPPNRCGYCNAFPCQCLYERRPEHQEVAVVSSVQISWSITSWQAHLGRLYGDQNKRRGMDDALIHAAMEIDEIISIIMRAEHLNKRPQEIASEFAKEASDIFAWLLSLCDLLHISLESAIITIYGQGCPVCLESVCACRAHEALLGEGEKSYRFMSTEEIAKRLK